MTSIWNETAPFDDSPRLPGLDLSGVDLTDFDAELEPALDFDATDDTYDSSVFEDDDDDDVISEFAPISRFVNE
ncbi:MAG: hypothetical protein O3A84_07130 [Proteobacteria bacterium]|nr:hypothetical protein [Pseudomonadota bacterium]